MKQTTPNLLLQKLLLRHSKKSRLFSAWFALFIGCTLLLLSVMIWANFDKLLNGKKDKENVGSTFITISKLVNDASMSNPEKAIINKHDVEKIKNAPQVQDAGLLQPANFKVSASLGYGTMSFYTLLFLEAAPDRFIDDLPRRWEWKEGNPILPIILSRDFLNMYNYIFAPSQGLPMMSEQTVKALGFSLIMGEGENAVKYKAQVEGFSDRISSVLVPESFIIYGNKTFAANSKIDASRMILKVADPSDDGFISFLKDNQLTTNSEQLRFSKMRTIVQTVSTSIGLLALLLMVLGVMVFVLFIQLTMAQAAASVKLLLLIGYSPKKLRLFLSKQYFPIMGSALFIAIIIALLVQYFVAQYLKSIEIYIPNTLSLFVWVAAGISAIILVTQIRFSIGNALNSKN